MAAPTITIGLRSAVASPPDGRAGIADRNAISRVGRGTPAARPVVAWFLVPQEVFWARITAKDLVVSSQSSLGFVQHGMLLWLHVHAVLVVVVPEENYQ
jgi:hypothetical protein